MYVSSVKLKMARLSLLFVLAAAVLALAAFSAQARKTSTFHIDAAAAPSSRIHIVHRHLPPSAIGKHGVHDATAPSGSKKQGHHAAALPGGKKQATHAAELSPDYQDFALPPEPYPGFYNCLEKLTEDCGVEIYGGIFGKDGVSSRCCGQLVGLGQRCHKGILEAALALPELAKTDRKEIKARDLEIWSHCVLITNLKVGNSRMPILP